jgi:hypothetical protein
MWCRRCAQDVPGVPSLEEGKYCCARCAEPLVVDAPDGSRKVRHDQKHRAVHDEGDAGANPLRPPSYDGWEIEEELRHVFRVLGPGRAAPAKQIRAARKAGAAKRKKIRLDAGHSVPSPHAGKTRRPIRRIDRGSVSQSPQPRLSIGDRLSALFVGTTLSLGTMAFGCGLALLGWSAYSGNRELWTYGAPIVLAGQIALVLGLVVQLDRIWRDSRRAAARLQTVDEEINDLKTTTSLLGTTHGPSAAFYAHWAGGAGPDLLLNDLKSQLDLLAAKLAK